MKLNEHLIIYHLANWRYLEDNLKLELLLQGENSSYTNTSLLRIAINSLGLAGRDQP